MADATTEGQEQKQGQTTAEVSDFSKLLKKEFRPKTDRAKDAVETAVATHEF